MKVRIDGEEFPAVNQKSAAPLHMMELQQQARPFVEGGLGMSRIERMGRDTMRYQRELKAWRVRFEAGEVTEDDAPLAPDDAILSVPIVVFLSLRAAGRKVTFEDAASIPEDRLEWIPEPGDVRADEAEEGEPDPTSPGVASPVTPDGDPALELEPAP